MRVESGSAVRIEAVSHAFGSVAALEGITLDIPVGSATAVIGPDGVGKSTLLGLIAGVRRLQSGQLAVLGGDMREPRHRDRVTSQIAYMPQGLGRSLYPTLSVAENIEFIGRLFGLDAVERERRMSRLLEATGLAPFRERAASKLSGGMKQKLSLCAVLIHEPDLLILDEPTTGIDPLSRRQFWSLIDALRNERPDMTVVVATAYMEEAERFPRLLAMDQGRVLAEGTACEILRRTGKAHVEEAYVALQVPSRRPPPEPVVLPPRPLRDGAPAIRAAGLTRRFGDFTAVDDVSFTIERGEIFGFLGSNGCGKTTTMKMLTGLLPVSSGRAELLGRPIEAQDIETRLRVGYMSQSFSLYEELSVRANLDLHARLFRIAPVEIVDRVEAALVRFDLDAVADELPMRLPLGIRQRLQLAAACLHKPEVLILDEPTSGVDPAARDMFWRTLIELSRVDGVTIFISTHFMSEAERCDRISLMHAGRVLAIATPAELMSAKGVTTLDDAFVAYLQAATSDGPASSPLRVQAEVSSTLTAPPTSGGQRPPISALAPSVARIGAFAWREAIEIVRDPVRLSFAFLGPLLLLLTFGYGITFDVDELAYAVLDRDRTAESRQFADGFSASRYFRERPRIQDEREIDTRLRSGELRLVLNIPPGFGKDLRSGRRPEIGVLLDGASPYRAETARGYVEGIVLTYASELAKAGSAAGTYVTPVRIEPVYRYNRSFVSALAIIPGSIMLIMALIPPMLAALAVVREREIGSISNLYASPATIGEFLLGKQLPYVVLTMLSFCSLVTMAVLHFGLIIKGSLAALVLAGLLYSFAMTGLGLLVSSFTRTQVAAQIATAVIAVVPAVNFSGFLHPAATLEGAARAMGHAFPALWFQNVAIGVFAKGRTFEAFAIDYLMLFVFGVGFVVAARLLLKKQEA